MSQTLFLTNYALSTFNYRGIAYINGHYDK